MCVKAVAQPNGLLFRNSHFQDTMGCCYTLITSLPEPLKRQAVQSQLVLCTNMISYKESGTASPARRTPCVQVKVELGAYAVEQYGRITLCTQQGFGTGNLQLLFLEQIKKVHKKKKKKKKKRGSVGLTETIFDMWCGKCLALVLWCRILQEEGDTLKRKRDETWTTEPTTEGRQDHASL